MSLPAHLDELLPSQDGFELDREAATLQSIFSPSFLRAGQSSFVPVLPSAHRFLSLTPFHAKQIPSRDAKPTTTADPLHPRHGVCGAYTLTCCPHHSQLLTPIYARSPSFAVVLPRTYPPRERAGRHVLPFVIGLSCHLLTTCLIPQPLLGGQPLQDVRAARGKPLPHAREGWPAVPRRSRTPISCLLCLVCIISPLSSAFSSASPLPLLCLYSPSPITPPLASPLSPLCFLCPLLAPLLPRICYHCA
jgi:hypothetical protein